MAGASLAQEMHWFHFLRFLNVGLGIKYRSRLSNGVEQYEIAFEGSKEPLLGI